MLAFLPDIATEHYEELQFLWAQRRTALRSPAYTMRELGLLEERIEAHVQGLLVLGDHLPEFLKDGLAGDDEMPAFAAAYALLRFGTHGAASRAFEAFATASGPKLDGIREALAHGPAKSLLPQLFQLWSGAANASAATAVAAGEVLAYHRALQPSAAEVERFLTADEPALRAAAWRVATYSGVALAPGRYEAGLRDDDPVARGAALDAAAWSAYPGFIAHCRALAAAPDPEVVEPLTLLAAVAPPQDLQAFATLAATPALGAGRFRILGAYGHPALADFCIREMESPDVEAAAAAGVAFAKLTGVSVEAGRRATVPPPTGAAPGEFDAEFLDEVQLPDPALARQHWTRLAPSFARTPRICRGLDMSAGLTRETFGALDMESRRELCLRARLTVGWEGTPLMLERFPQRG